MGKPGNKHQSKRPSYEVGQLRDERIEAKQDADFTEEDMKAAIREIAMAASKEDDDREEKADRK